MAASSVHYIPANSPEHFVRFMNLDSFYNFMNTIASWFKKSKFYLQEIAKRMGMQKLNCQGSCAAFLHSARNHTLCIVTHHRHGYGIAS